MTRIGWILLLLIKTGTLYAQKIEYIKADINVDGILDEAVWNEVAPITGFYNYYPVNEGVAEMQTEVKIYHNGTHLYVSAVHHDTVADVRVNSLKRDDYGAGFHLSDHFAIVIDPYNNQNRGYYFGLNGSNNQIDALIANYSEENTSWDAKWEGKTSVQGTDKIYEFKIPLNVISYDADTETWSVQFYHRDSKISLYTLWHESLRGYFQFDTRLLKPVAIDNLPSPTIETIVTPSATLGRQVDKIGDTKKTTFTPSLDVQRKISDGLTLDLAINPDFSQADVDVQVTNLSRFDISFPERRKFFIENSDMFSNLGTDGVTPFYSRRIGASRDILMGLKLSGNLLPKTRIGILNVHSKIDTNRVSENYTVATIKQELHPRFHATGYFINRQELSGYESTDGKDRNIGLKVNFLSPNKLWSTYATLGNSLNGGGLNDRMMYAAHAEYKTRKVTAAFGATSVGKDFETRLGFTPRSTLYDPSEGVRRKVGYRHIYARTNLFTYPQTKYIRTYRYALIRLGRYWDHEGKVTETNYFLNNALWFQNNSAGYINLYHDDVNLRYGFSPTRNGHRIAAGKYQNTSARLGYYTDHSRRIYGEVSNEYGTYFGGRKLTSSFEIGYRYLPILSMHLNYTYNHLDFDTYKTAIHLVGLKTEVFFSSTLNWTTYLQYNQQQDNMNINSRVQWEYQPLSFVYLVLTDNYTKEYDRKNWGVTLKINKRLHL